jgi:cytochrome c551/c552
MWRSFLVSLLLWGTQQPPLAVGGDDLRPGLLAHYRSLEKDGGTLTRVDLKPAFTLGHSSPHPRISPGPFEVTWTGVVQIQDAEPIVFDAFVGGDVTVAVSGVPVLEARGDTEASHVVGTRALEAKPGLHAIEIQFRSRPGVPARLQLGWRGKTFVREPLPAWRLKHLLKDEPAGLELAERGREAVARFGCARCHAGALPGVDDPPQGPSLADVGDRANRSWLLAWLEHPATLHAGARMPSLFSSDRKGLVERWVVADTLVRATSTGARRDPSVKGDHRLGKRHFVLLGCAACHFLPDEPDQPELGQITLEGLNDRMGARDLVAFLLNPHARYPDGRMPRIPMTPEAARDLAAYILMWSKPAMADAAVEPPVTPKEIDEVAQRLGVRGVDAAGQALLREKGCVSCHVGVGERGGDVAMKTPGPECRGPRFDLDAEIRKSIGAYLVVAAQERHASPFENRRRLIRRVGCLRCHVRDADRPPPIEAIGSTLGGSMLETIPFQRTPRLSNALSKFERSYVVSTVRDGAVPLRGPRYSYRMPSFGTDAETIVQALAEEDGDLPSGPQASSEGDVDPTLASVGPGLIGFEGYSCVSCHVWNGKRMSEADPGAVGPELTSTTRRIRRDWFDRWMDDPARVHPGTPMPQIFKRGQPATLKSILEGDPAKQKEALWAYFALGKDAPAPKPLQPLEVHVPADGPLVAEIPVTLPDQTVVESIAILFPSRDLVVYDVESLSLRNVYLGATLLRRERGRVRSYVVVGTPIGPDLKAPAAGAFVGYERLADGARILTREGETLLRLEGRTLRVGTRAIELPPARPAPRLEHPVLADPGRPEGPMEQPGYRAIAYPRPKTASGEDLVMPGAIAVHPREGRVYVASMKLGEIFTIRDPQDDGKNAVFEDYAGGLFQEAYSMLAESDGLYVLHRRNLSKITEKDGRAERVTRVAALRQAAAEAYDYGYGLARDAGGAFVWSHAQYGDRTIPGAGSMLRLLPDGKVEEVAYGFRNPLGWVAGPDGTIFFTDNQGEWVATNKLCAIVPGRFYGFPNRAQKEHAQKPAGKPTVWVPYGWAHSINGVTVDKTGGKFGPFAGQFFLAELMFGGAIIRASVEKVNGEWQGCAIPFWGKGLLGPLTLAFDPKGRLWVGSITEPGWMAQPDRGGVFRIDYTGEMPFEMKEIRILPDGFRIAFTRPADRASAADAASYSIEHYRYEYTGAYGSPELDRTRVEVGKVAPSADGWSVDLTTSPLARDRVYLITARGVKSSKGDPLVHPTGAYTVNEIPR